MLIAVPVSLLGGCKEPTTTPWWLGVSCCSCVSLLVLTTDRMADWELAAHNCGLECTVNQEYIMTIAF